jgi:2-polyprenyl-3-methyl-5-hydroxy-6-metoxy-1,4-benzoquinol methylase
MLNPVRLWLLRALDRRGYYDTLYGSLATGPTWDINRPQPEFVRLAETGEVKGEVLDVGCGTGENALFFAELGHRVLGIDLSSKAIEKARSKALQRKVMNATFIVGDVSDLARMGRVFDTVIDCGLFVNLTEEKRQNLSRCLFSVLRPGGGYLQLSGSEIESTGARVSRDDISRIFRDGWRINYIREARQELHDPREGTDYEQAALLSSINRL